MALRDSLEIEARALRWLDSLMDDRGRIADADEAREFGEPAEVRERIASLVASARRVAGFLESPPIAAVVESPVEGGLPAGTLVGGYTIQRLIGRGGTADVYEAMRIDGAEAVALKVFRAGTADPRVQRQAEHEFYALHRVTDHRIARALAHGLWVTPEGDRPYVAMELVKGTRLADALAAKSLDRNQVLTLIAEVAEAMHQAHQRGVIHRDLKPSNIMIRDGAGGSSQGSPSVMVLDFGIAAIAGLSTTTALTSMTQGPKGPTAGILGTLPYMSPEQVSGLGSQVDLRTDIYSLGIILFEALAGRLPLDPSQFTVPGMLYAIVSKQPSRMFTRASSAERDLEIVVARAIAKRPDARYQSALALAQDIRAILSGQRPSVRPPSLLETLVELRRRQPIASAVAMAALAVVLLAVAVTTTQWLRARSANHAKDDAFRHLMNQASSLIFEVDDAVRGLPGSAQARIKVISRAVALYEAAQQMRPNDPEVLDQLAGAYNKLSSSLGSPGEANVGDVITGRSLMLKSVAIRRQLAAMDPANAQRQSSLALYLFNLILFYDQPADQRPLVDEMVAATRRALATMTPEYAGAILQNASSCLSMAADLSPEPAARDALYDEVVQLARSALNGPHPTDDAVLDLGTVLERVARDRIDRNPISAIILANEAIARLEPLSQRPATRRNAGNHLALARAAVAVLALSNGDLDRFERDASAAVEMVEELYRLDEANSFQRRVVETVYEFLANQGASNLAKLSDADAIRRVRAIVTVNASRAKALLQASIDRGQFVPDGASRLDALNRALSKSSGD